MKAFSILATFFVAFVVLSMCTNVNGEEEKKSTAKKQLQIGVKKRVENCKRTSKKGDTLHM